MEQRLVECQQGMSRGLQSGTSRSLAAWGRALGARRSRQVLQVAQELVPEGAHLLRVHDAQVAQDACLVRLLLQQRAKRPVQDLHTVQTDGLPYCSLTGECNTQSPLQPGGQLPWFMHAARVTFSSPCLKLAKAERSQVSRHDVFI